MSTEYTKISSNLHGWLYEAVMIYSFRYVSFPLGTSRRNMKFADIAEVTCNSLTL